MMNPAAVAWCKSPGIMVSCNESIRGPDEAVYGEVITEALTTMITAVDAK